MKKVGGSDEKTYLEAMKQTLTELAMHCASSPSGEEFRKKMDTSLKNIMSDQRATNGIFNRLLQDIRKDLLPAFITKCESHWCMELFSLVNQSFIACFNLFQPSRARED